MDHFCYAVMKHHVLVNITSPLLRIDLVCYSGVNL